jgi:uncharacterized protein YoxC
MSDKITVDIKDFQSLKKAYIELTPGITVITGATNNGKSAIIRAIDSALFNLGDDAMVRGGQRYYGIKISNGSHTMLMARDNVGKNEKTAYQFDDGTVQKKVGRGQLEEVSRMFNIREVKMNNGTKMKINFWYQNDKPFLMDKTAGQLYEFLSLSSCDNYARVLKSLGSDVRSINSDINTLTTEINTYKSLINDKKDFLSKNDGFDSVYQEALDVDAMGDLHSNTSSVLDDIDTYSHSVQRLNGLKSKLDDKLSTIDMGSIRSLYSDIDSINSKVEAMCELLSYIDDISIRISRLSDMYRELHQTIEDSNSSITEFSLLLGDAEKISSDFDRISVVMVDVDTNSKYLDSLNIRHKDILSSMCVDIDKISSDIDILDSFSSEVISCENCLVDVGTAKGVLDSYAQRVKDLKTRVSESNAEFEQLKKDIGYCPYCRREFF